ncbi:MAG: penicillin-binding transpeptidase domain-containing protein [Terriglobia bacterium]
MAKRRWVLAVVVALALLGDCLPVPFPGEAAAASVAQKKKAQRKRRRRRARYRVPTYTNPTKSDKFAGEDAGVRTLAAQALGRLNGSVVVVDADSGRVLTIVNQKLAFSAGFKPCSTIKIAVALGSLAEGLITADTLVRVSRYKSLNLVEALAYSDNRFFEILGKRLGFEKVSAYARLLGFGELAGYLIEDEYPGSFPSRPPRRGGVGRMSSFGEEIKVTPLQLASLMAAFANGGKLFYLQYPGDAEQVAAFTPRIKRHLPIQRWLPELRAGMEAAVLYGTARVSAEAEERILGKTGTCSDAGAKLGWFSSYGVLPTGQKIVVVVLLRGGRAMAGGKAAEIAGEVYHRLSEEQVFADRPRTPATTSVEAQPPQ